MNKSLLPLFMSVRGAGVSNWQTVNIDEFAGAYEDHFPNLRQKILDMPVDGQEREVGPWCVKRVPFARDTDNVFIADADGLIEALLRDERVRAAMTPEVCLRLFCMVYRDKLVGAKLYVSPTTSWADAVLNILQKEGFGEKPVK